MTEFGAMLAWLGDALPYPFLLPLLGAFFGGEETIILISMLSATGFIPFPVVVFSAFLGTMFSDVLWFLFGQRFVSWLETKARIRRGFASISEFVNRITRHNRFLTLLITKFLYGTRLITIFYLGRERMGLFTFTLYNSVVTAIWAVVVCSVGFFAGRGAIQLVSMYGNITYAVTFVAVLGIVFYSIRIWLNQKIITEEREQLS